MLDPIAHQLERYMTLMSERQTLVASNIANADTPGYKTRDIDFQSEFQNALGSFGPMVKEVSGLTLKNDGNNVDLDREARLLADNALHFSVASNVLHSEVKRIRMAIEGDGQSS